MGHTIPLIIVNLNILFTITIFYDLLNCTDIIAASFLPSERTRIPQTYNEMTSKGSDLYLGSKQKSDTDGCTVITWFL